MKPDFKAFKNLAGKFSLVPTYEELPSDLETPVTVFLKVSRPNPYSALLESVEGGEKLGRYSFISVSHHLRFESSGRQIEVEDEKGKRRFQCKDALNELRKILIGLDAASIPELPRFCGGAVGMVSYDMARNFERLPHRLNGENIVPDMLFLFTDECVVFDHWKHKMFLIKWNRIGEKSERSLKKVYRQAEKSLQSLYHLYSQLCDHIHHYFSTFQSPGQSADALRTALYFFWELILTRPVRE